jgi:hypothetical protein
MLAVNQFCTITTQSHLYKAHALAESLNTQGDALLNILIVDGHLPPNPNSNCKYWKLSDFGSNATALEIIKKYASNKNKLRWSLKPVFLKHLLQQPEIEKMVYVDNDLFFYSTYEFIFDLLDGYSILLTPHYYKNDPKQEQNWLEANFRVGLYNAGFVAVNKNAQKVLQWWAECCMYRCEKNSFRGLFDDQKYLDLIPVMEERSHVIRHKGCNVAGWNIELCKREVVNNKVMIDGEFPIVFIHFNETTIREILNGKDKLLLSFYLRYVQTLKIYKDDLNESSLLINQPLSDKLKLKVWKIFTELGV